MRRDVGLDLAGLPRHDSSTRHTLATRHPLRHGSLQHIKTPMFLIDSHCHLY